MRTARMIVLALSVVLMFCVSAWGSVEINATTFPDEVFRSYVSSNFDTDSDDVLSDSEIANVTSIAVDYMGITTLKGVEYFTALTWLECDNNQLTGLDVSSNTALTYLFCNSNDLTTLEVSHNTALTILNCGGNQLTELDVSDNIALTNLYCWGNRLTSLDVSRNTALKWLDCDSNCLTALDLSRNPSLDIVDRASQIRTVSLDITGNTTYPYSVNLVGLNASLDISKVSVSSVTDFEGTDLT